MGREVGERRFTADELTSAMDQLHALSTATWRELLVHVAEYDAAGAWRADGMASMADWLIARYGLDRSTAHEWVRTARSLAELPAIADAVGTGRPTSPSSRAAPMLSSSSPAPAWRKTVTPTGPRSSCTSPPPGSRRTTTSRSTPPSRRRSTTAYPSRTTRSAVWPAMRVHLLGEGPGAEALARTAVEHTVPQWLRRQLNHRDGGCRWRGCRRTRALHAHHLVWFSKGGRTVPSNLVRLCGLCRRHHRAVHEGGWRIEGDPAGTLHYIRPDGRLLPERPPPLAPDRREWLRKHLPHLGAIPRLAFEPG